ncbi:MAG: translation elongation factor Ts [Myxococcota bacterium]
MAEIGAARVKALRDRTGAGMMDCKKALVEAEGDVERALDLLRERGLAKARGKAGRATSEGLIVASLSEDGRRAVLLEVNCETDFVARTDRFRQLCRELAEIARESAVEDVATLLDQPHGSATVKEALTEAVAQLGENLRVRRIERLEAGEKGRVARYIHAGGKIGSLVQVEADDPARPEVRTLAHNVSMHVAATSPLAVSRDDIDADDVARERAVLEKQAQSEGKPPQVVEKMVLGRLNKFFKEVVLLEQPLVMDPDRSVAKAAEEAGVRVVAFRRFQLGEDPDA